MSIQQQYNAKHDEIRLLYSKKEAEVKSGVKTFDGVWRGEGRKDYDQLRAESIALYKQMPYVPFDELMDEATREKKYMSIKIGVINTDTVEMLAVDSEGGVRGEESIAQLKEFMAKHPDFVYTQPYEGEMTYFFSKKPKLVPIFANVMLHRGAVGQVKDCPSNVLIIMDMD